MGWILCNFRDRCALCGHRSQRVWRHFRNQHTSDMSVCETCADALHTSTEQERA